MKYEIKVPRMGESISEATVSAILKPAGSYVKMDDELLELATDKVNQVIYATAAGVFTPLVTEEEIVVIDQILGHIDSESLPTELLQPEVSGSRKEVAEPNLKESGPIVQSPVASDPEKVKKIAPDSSSVRYSASDFLEGLKAPLQKMQAQSEKAAEGESKVIREVAGGSSRPNQTASSLSVEKETRRKMSKIRSIIARRLVDVQHTTAMLTTFNEVDMTAIIALRERYQELFVKQHGGKLGFISFFVKAVAAALQRFPDLNSYIAGEEIVQRHYCHIGIAVATEKGLIVPVLRDCDQLSCARIEKSIADYAKKAREGKLSPDDLMGAGFTITNGGVYGSLLSTPILSPQQCAILGMHKIAKRAVVVGNEMVIRDMMYLALSYDHRIIDGKEAVSFLVHIKEMVEDPARLLLEV